MSDLLPGKIAIIEDQIHTKFVAFLSGGGVQGKGVTAEP